MRTTILFFLSICFLNYSYSQCQEWNWPSKRSLRSIAEAKYVEYNKFVKGRQYEAAIPALNWLLTNTPNLQDAIYINAEQVFSNLADNANTNERQAVYADSLMLIFDMRMKYCPKNSILDRKALYGFKYFYKDDTKSEWILEMYNKSLNVNGAKIMDSNVKYHMIAVQLVAFNVNNLSEEQILEYYNKLRAILVTKKALNPANTKKYDQMEKELDDILGTAVNYTDKHAKTDSVNSIQTISEGFDFRRSSWGMTKTQVKATEASKILNDDSGFLIYSENVLSMDVLVIYIFVDDQLVRARYVFKEDHTNKNDYIDDYKSVVNVLRDKYGNPILDKENWRNDLYKADLDKWGFAVSLGHLTYFSTWETASTKIITGLSGDNYTLEHVTEYTSKKLNGLEEKKKRRRINPIFSIHLNRRSSS